MDDGTIYAFGDELEKIARSKNVIQQLERLATKGFHNRRAGRRVTKAQRYAEARGDQRAFGRPGMVFNGPKDAKWAKHGRKHKREAEIILRQRIRPIPG